MKRIFTKNRWFIVLVLVLGTALSASAQSYPEYTPPATINAGITATTKDSQGNVYTIQCTGDPYVYGRLTGEVVKYPEGSTTGSVISGTNIIPYTDSETANDYPIGIAVDQNFNIYVTTYYDFNPSNGGDPTIYGNIILFAYNSSTQTYTATNPLITGTSSLGIFSALVCDSSGDLFATAYSSSLNPGNGGGFELVEYTYNSSTKHVDITPHAKYASLADNEYAHNPSGDTYSPCSAMAIDASDNIYVATTFDTQGSDGGSILELDATHGYTSVSKTIGSSPFCIALAVDASYNVYAANGSGSSSAFKLVTYTYNSGTGTYSGGTSEYSGALYNWGNLFPGGLAVMSDGVIYGGAGASTNYPENETSHGGTTNSPALGTLAEFSIPVGTQAKSITFTSTTETATGINWTNGTGAGRAVFVAQSTSQPSAPALSTGTSYTGSLAYGSGSAVGSWYCVYTGTGSSPITVTNLTANKPYWVQVVEYDGSGATLDYDTNPGSGNPASFTTDANPVVTTSGGTDSYSSGGPATTVDNGITVTGGQTDLTTATVNISSGYSSGDALNFTNQNGITGSYSAGTLTLTGSATAANYQTAFRSITFSSSSSAGGARTVSFTVSDGTATSSAVTKTINITPTISTSGTPSALSTTAGTASSSTSFSASGTNLVGSITAQAPSGFDISLNNSSWSAAGGSQPINESGGAAGPQTIYIRLDAGDAVNTYSGSVSLSSSGASTMNVTIPSSSVTNPATTISSLTAVNSTPTNATSVQYTATFAASISGLTTGNFSFVPGSIASASVTGVSEVSGTTWTVTVNTGSGDGSIQLELSNASGISPSVTNTGFTGTTYTIDKTAPTVSLITAASPSNASPTNATSVTYTVTFSEAVTGVDATDFALTTSGVSGSVSGVSGSGTTYTVTVNSISGTGTLRLDLKSSGTGITDAAGNAISGGFTSGNVYTIDQTAPTVSSITATTPSNASPTNATSVTYTVTFSEAVTGVDATDFALTTSGTSGSVSGVSGSGTTYSVTVSSISGSGTLRLDLKSSGTGIIDVAGNAISGGFTSGSVYTIDQTPPTVSSITATGTSPTNATSVGYTVTFSESVTGVDATDFTVTTGGASGSVTNVTGSGTTYTVTVGSISGDGTLRLDLNSSGTGITDGAGNAISGGFTGGDTYTIDNTPPTVSSIAASNPLNNNPTNATSLTYHVNFSESVTGVDASDFTVTTSGTSGSVTNVSGSGANYTVTVSSVAGNGTLRLDLNNSGTGITDAAGNAISGGFTSGDVYTIDNIAPTVSSITAISPSNTNPTNATSVSYTVTFSEAVTGVGSTSFTATTTNTVAWTGIVVTPVSSSLYTVTVNGIGGDGTLRLDLNSSNNGVLDLAGNPISGGFTGGDVYTIDNTAPGVVLANYGSTNSNSILWAKVGDIIALDVEYNETVQTPVVTIGGHSVTPIFGLNTWASNYTLTSGDIEGPIAFDIQATDPAGNTTETSSASTGKFITFDMTPPTVMISAPSVSQISSGGAGTVTYTVTYADANFNTSTTPAITLNSPGTATGTVVVSGSGTSYTVTLSGITGLGTLGISVGAGYASDLAGNTDGGAGPSATFNVVSSDATLSNLTLDNGILTPGFLPGTISYSASVRNAIASINITPTVNQANAVVTINGSPASSGSASNFALSPGVGNVFSILVTAQDGTPKTYTLTVTRAPSSNANLHSIGSSVPITPVLSSGTSYTASVSNTITSVTVKPVTSDPNAKMKINGTPTPSGTTFGPVALTAGVQTVISIAVMAQDGSTNKTYTLTVTRQLSGNAHLTSLKTSPGNLAPNFSPGQTSYTESVINSVSAMTITPTATDANATIKVNGTPVTSGTAYGPVTLAEGTQTVINTEVTAQDGTTKTYTVTVTRAPSTNANLVSMGASVPVTPGFSSGNTSYTASVSNATATMTVKPVTSDAKATLTVNGTPTTSGTVFGPIALTAGAQTVISIAVMPQDGSTTKTYTLTVTRAAGSIDSYDPSISVTKPTETPTLAEDGIQVHQGISPNGDGINDFLQIDNITQYPDNKLMIMNRNGQLVFEARGYDNSSKVFDGHSNKNGQMQLPGTYFYQLDYTVNGIAKHKTGFIILKY